MVNIVRNVVLALRCCCDPALFVSSGFDPILHFESASLFIFSDLLLPKTFGWTSHDVLNFHSILELSLSAWTIYLALSCSISGMLWSISII